MSLRDGASKMSKSEASDNSRINLTDSPDDMARKIRRAKTDPGPLPGTPVGLEARPEAANLVGIFASLANLTVAETCQKFEGASFSTFKEALTDLAVSELVPITTEMRRLMTDVGQVESVLKAGADRAAARAEPILREVHELIGLVRPPER